MPAFATGQIWMVEVASALVFGRAEGSSLTVKVSSPEALVGSSEGSLAEMASSVNEPFWEKLKLSVYSPCWELSAKGAKVVGS